ncbi:MAG: S-methyl-5-thioribose-1-phosphate isomerase [Gammaproteobacteria bacterium]
MSKPEQAAFPDTICAVSWQDGGIKMLDQRLLPARERYLQLDTAPGVADAIREMAIRGAPAIGIAAAYGVVLAARKAYQRAGGEWRTEIEPCLQQLVSARPTAVNLEWAIERMRRVFPRIEDNPENSLLHEAQAIHEEDRAANRRMGALGAGIIKDTRSVLTHCNTGSLATGGYGTALGVIRTAFANHTLAMVYASETRPWLQGARLTVWELAREKIPVTLIADSAVGYLMRTGRLGWVIVGADRIAANGDVANKIGTYSHAVNARHHGIGFMVVAPLSSIDPTTLSGDDIPIEQRPSSELIYFAGDTVTPFTVNACNPVFDITPAGLIDVIVTEKGVVHDPDEKKIMGLLED